MKRFLKMINPKVPKQILLFIAGLVWGLISIRILLLFIKYLNLVRFNHLLLIAAGILGYIIFFRLVFFNLVRKHVKRIISKTADKVCIFSFFDLKSYLLMAIMISIGVVSTTILHPSAILMSAFFFALGISLLTSSIYFFYYGIRYKYAIQKFV